MKGLQRFSAQEHSAHLKAGYQTQVVSTISVYGGRAYNETSYTKTIDMSCIEKTIRVGIGSIVCIGSLGLIPCCSSEFNESMFTAPIDGKLMKKGYVLDQKISAQWQADDSKKLGFDPDDKASVRTYAGAQQSKFQEHLGHKFLTFYTPVSKSSRIIFLPNGNIDQAEVVALYNIETGASLSTAELRRTAMTYCASYKGEVEGFSVLRNPTVTVYGALIAQV